MSRRTIYVAEQNVGLYEEAAVLAGSLSAAVEQGLRLLLDQQRFGWVSNSRIEVLLGRGSARERKVFRGRQVLEKLLDPLDAVPEVPKVGRFGPAKRLRGITVYLTAGGRLAVLVWNEPDTRGMRESVIHRGLHESLATGAGEVEVDDLGQDDFDERRGEEFLVFETIDQLRDQFQLDARELAQLAHAWRAIPTEVLDI